MNEYQHIRKISHIAFPKTPIFKTISSDCFLESFPQMNPIVAVGIIINKFNPSEEINIRIEITNSNNGTIFNKMPPLFNQFVLFPFSFFNITSQLVTYIGVQK
jgi:hypothetical protein